MAALEQQVEAALSALPLDLPPGRAAKLAALLAELEKWNRRINLTAIRDPAEMIRAHLVDSLAALPFLEGETVLDVGTGAGFPGLPLAVADDQRRFELIDSKARKIRFVQHVTKLLDLDNVTACQARMEDYAPGHRFDTVIARAVAAVPRLLELAGHHVGEDGVFVALKGRHPADELQSVPGPWVYECIELDLPGFEKGSRHAVLLRRRD